MKAFCCSSIIVFLAGALLASFARADGTLPSYYQDPGISPVRSTVNHNNDEHIDPFTGMLQLHHVDATLPGNGGLDLVLQRSFNSPSPLFGTSSDTMSYNRTPNIGIGWNLVIGGRVFGGLEACGGNHQMVFETPDGGRQGLIATGTGDFLSASRWRALCVAGGVQVFAPNGTRYDMTEGITEIIPNTIGNAQFLYPTLITDRNGNFASFSYSVQFSSTVLDSVTTSDGRSLTFSYGIQNPAGPDSTVPLLRTVSAGARTWSFVYYNPAALSDPYTGKGVAYLLAGVAPPIGGTWGYSYNACPSLTAGSCSISVMGYPEGGTIAYTYTFVDFHDNRGNTSVVATKKTGGYEGLGGTVNNNWQYSYAPGAFGQNDVTTVTTSLGTMTYEHVGFPTVGPGSLWQVGLLMKRVNHDIGLGDVETQTFTWDKQQISPYPTDRGYGMNDGATFAPLTTQHVITRSGNTYTTSYSNFDQFGNPQTIDEAGERSHTITRTYFTDATKWIINIPQNDSITGLGDILRSFDTQGNLLSETRFGVATAYTYSSSDGSLTSRTDANGHATVFGNYFRGIAQNEARPEGVTITRTVDDAGNVTSQTDGAGHLYNYTYDLLRRLASKTPPVGAPTTVDWTGNTLRVATRGSYVDSLTLDGLANPLLATKGGVKFAFVFDTLNRKIFESLPGQVTQNATGYYVVGTQFARDIIGRVTQITNSDGSVRSIINGGNSDSVKDENFFTTVNHYVAFGDPDKRFLVGIDAPINSITTTIGKDDLGNITSVQQGVQAQPSVNRTYHYDGSYFLTSIDDPETGTTAFERDSVGNMKSRTVGNRKTTYTYDGLNRMTGIAYPNGDSVAITYLGNGRTASVTGSHAARTYSYDDNANLTSESLTVGGQSFTISYTYDANDALATITYPKTGEVISYLPDPLGRPTTANPFITGIGYFDSSNLKQMVYASGVTMNYDEDVRQWPKSMSAGKGGSVPDFLGKSYAYDHVGNLFQSIDNVDPRQSLQMSYDGLNQLGQTLGPWGTAHSFYDAVGNLKEYDVGGATGSYFYTSDNKLASFNSNAFSYDTYGNVAADGRHLYQYDDASNLVCVDCGTATEIDYVYDGNNRRVSRTQNGVTTYYVPASNGDLLLEYTPASDRALEHIYVHGKRIASKTVP